MIKEVRVEFMDNEPIYSEYVCVMDEVSSKATLWHSVKILKFSSFYHQFSVFLDFLKNFFLYILGGVRGSHLYIFFFQKVQKLRKLLKKGGKLKNFD